MLHAEQYPHSYLHRWRHKTLIIFRHAPSGSSAAAPERPAGRGAGGGGAGAAGVGAKARIDAISWPSAALTGASPRSARCVGRAYRPWCCPSASGGRSLQRPWPRWSRCAPRMACAVSTPLPVLTWTRAGTVLGEEATGLRQGDRHPRRAVRSFGVTRATAYCASAAGCRAPADMYLEGLDQPPRLVPVLHLLIQHRQLWPGALQGECSPASASPWTATAARCQNPSAM